MTTQTTFEDRLLDQLRLVVAANAAPPEPGARHLLRRRWSLTAVGLTAAGVASAVVVVIPGGTQPAYAVDSRPDGTVTVRIASLRDSAGLQAALRARGIPAIVDYSATCRLLPARPAGNTSHPSPGRRSFSQVEQTRAPAPGRSAMHRGVRVQLSKETNHAGGVTFMIDPNSVPGGQNLFITTYSRRMNALSIGIGAKAPTPPCPPAG